MAWRFLSALGLIWGITLLISGCNYPDGLTGKEYEALPPKDKAELKMPLMNSTSRVEEEMLQEKHRAHMK